LLLDVAADEFRCHGYKGAVLKEIASKAGILPGSLYHYFRSKEDLLTQVHHASFTELNLAVDAALKGLTDPTERLRAACRKHLELLLSGNPLSRFAGVRLFVPTDGPLNARMIGDRDAYEKRFRRLVTAVPLPPRVDPSLLRLGLLGALNWSQVWYKPGQKSPGAIADELVGIFIGAAHERPGEAAARPATDGRARAKRSSARR
jgi:AcrR family transcriptional regulator